MGVWGIIHFRIVWTGGEFLHIKSITTNNEKSNNYNNSPMRFGFSGLLKGVK